MTKGDDCEVKLNTEEVKVIKTGKETKPKRKYVRRKNVVKEDSEVKENSKKDKEDTKKDKENTKKTRKPRVSKKDKVVAEKGEKKTKTSDKDAAENKDEITGECVAQKKAAKSSVKKVRKPKATVSTKTSTSIPTTTTTTNATTTTTTTSTTSAVSKLKTPVAAVKPGQSAKYSMVYKFDRNGNAVTSNNATVIENRVPMVVTDDAKAKANAVTVKRKTYRKLAQSARWRAVKREPSNSGMGVASAAVRFQNPIGDLDLDAIEASVADGGYAPYGEDVDQALRAFHRSVKENTPRAPMRTFQRPDRPDIQQNVAPPHRKVELPTSSSYQGTDLSQDYRLPIAYSNDMMGYNSFSAGQHCGDGDYHPSHVYSNIDSFMSADNGDRLRDVGYRKLVVEQNLGGGPPSAMGVSTATHATRGARDLVKPKPTKRIGYVGRSAPLGQSSYLFVPIRSHPTTNGYNDEFMNSDTVGQLQYVEQHRQCSRLDLADDRAAGTLAEDLSDQMRAGDPVYVPMYDEACGEVVEVGVASSGSTHWLDQIDAKLLPPYAPAIPFRKYFPSHVREQAEGDLEFEEDPNCSILQEIMKVRLRNFFIIIIVNLLF